LLARQRRWAAGPGRSLGIFDRIILQQGRKVQRRGLWRIIVCQISYFWAPSSYIRHKRLIIFAQRIRSKNPERAAAQCRQFKAIRKSRHPAQRNAPWSAGKPNNQNVCLVAPRFLQACRRLIWQNVLLVSMADRERASCFLPVVSRLIKPLKLGVRQLEGKAW
jgi:hypothetical protein